MNSIKQLFCRHVWKVVDEEFLERKRLLLGCLTYTNYDYYAVHRKCIKCGCVKIKQKRYMII